MLNKKFTLLRSFLLGSFLLRFAYAEEAPSYKLQHLTSWVTVEIDKGNAEKETEESSSSLFEVIPSPPHSYLKEKKSSVLSEGTFLYPLQFKVPFKTVVRYEQKVYTAADRDSVQISLSLFKEGVYKFPIKVEFPSGHKKNYQIKLTYKIPEDITLEFKREERAQLYFAFDYTIWAGFSQFNHQDELSRFGNSSWPIFWGQWEFLFKKLGGLVLRGSILASHWSFQGQKSKLLDLTTTDFGLGYDLHLKNFMAGVAVMRTSQNLIPNQNNESEEFKLVSTSLWNLSARSRFIWAKIMLGYEFRWAFPQGISTETTTSLTSALNHQIKLGYQIFPPFYLLVGANIWDYVQRTNETSLSEGSKAFFVGFSQELP